MTQNTIQALIAQYNELYSEDISTSVTDFKVQRQVKPDAQPIFRRYYNVLLHLRDRVYKELI